MAPDTASIEKMTLAEKLAWIEALWSSVRESRDIIPTPKSHLKLVRKRLKGLKGKASDASDADEFLDELEREFQ